LAAQDHGIMSHAFMPGDMAHGNSMQALIKPLSNDGLTAAEFLALHTRSLAPNAFYNSGFLAGSLLLKEKQSISVLETRDSHGQMTGFLPFRRSVLRETGFLPILKAYQNPFILRTEPVLDNSNPIETAMAMLDALAQHAGLLKLFLFPMLDLEGPVFASLQEAARRQSRSFQLLKIHQRAALKAGDSLPASKLKKAEKLMRKLQERGEVTVIIGQGGKKAKPLLDAFLRVESSGWKGKQGTGLASQATTEAFARRAGDPARTDTVYDALMFDGQPIAVNMNLVAGTSIMTIKSGYDEAFRSFSPGIILDTLFSRHGIQQGSGWIADSCAIPGHHLEQLWPSRLSIGSMLIDIAPTPSRTSFKLRAKALTSMMQIKEKAKILVGKFRR
jgi:hypothetical protein